MRKLKNIAISMLLVIVIAIGLSATIFADTRAPVYMNCDEAYVTRYAPEFGVPYRVAYAKYSGYGLDSEFQAYVWLNVNNKGAQWNHGNSSWSTSSATVIQEPAYPTDTYTWSHGYLDATGYH